jgi:hypothetical protein
MRLALLAAALMLGSSANAACIGAQCPPFSGRTTIQQWPNGTATIRDNSGNRATVQTWGNGTTTIRGSNGTRTTCQTWANGLTTCR